jgi:hypothetical protein
MKTSFNLKSTQAFFRLLLTSAFCLLLSFSALAQSYNAGYKSGTDGTQNVFVGAYAGGTTTSSSNSFLGYAAGAFNKTGDKNSFIGAGAGIYNSTGNNNSFLGAAAGHENTTGYQNSFLGAYAGYSSTTGYQNSFLGYNAGYFNTTGNTNSFLGSYAGNANTTGSSNSFVGYQAGYANTTGFYNCFLGYQAGASNTSASGNSFLGYLAGNKNKTGSYNTSLGYTSGYSCTTGSFNSFLGTSAGYSNTTGSDNSFLGYAAGYRNLSGKENIFLGRYAGYNSLGSANLFLGSNTNSPVNVNLSNAGAIGSRAYVTASNALVLGSINGVNGATASTKVGIGTTAPTYLLQVNGTAAKPGGGSWTVASDKRLKKNISTFKDGLDVLQKVKPVWFEYNGEAGMPTEKKYVGVIAQEIQKIAPYTVGEFTYQDSTGKQENYLDYDANALTYILVNSVKEQQGKIEELQQVVEQKDAQLSSQQQQINTLTNQLAQLEAALSKLIGEPLKATGSAAQLYQNAPNPTEGATVIGYFLPRETVSAQLKIYSLTGAEVRSIELKGRGKGEVRLSVGELADGQYIYHLLVDGQSVASQKLLLHR